MELEDADRVIKQRFMTEWALVEPTVKYVFDNDPRPEGVPSYIRLSLAVRRGGQSTQGDIRKYRREGFINVKVNTPIAAGPKGGQAMCTKVKNIFEGVTFGQTVGEPEGVVCHLVDTGLPLGSDGQFWTLLCVADVHWYDTH